MTITTSGTSITFNDATVQTTAYVAAAAIIPVGSVMLFYQSAAPTGWTQVTTLNDYDLRLVSGTGGSTGGTTAYSTVFTNQSPTTGATTLSTGQIPSHTHDLITPVAASCGGVGLQGLGGSSTTLTTNATGGGGSHTHSGGTVTLNVRYANIIICSKN
jgi:hypothetical protein